ncbi:MAG: hypothetical protein LBS80_02725 [Tannerella sp.]|jgi:hypothetical protein|nr:hypothetical protein [Tannerella sp.]
MKAGRLYVLVMCIFVALVFISDLYSPHKFSWEQTFDKHSHEPFGLYVSDDVLSTSVAGYTVVDSTLPQIYESDSLAAPRSFLIIEKDITMSETDVACLYRILHQGNKVMLCTSYMPPRLSDSINISSSSSYHISIDKYIRQDLSRDTIYYGSNIIHPIAQYSVYPQMHDSYLTLSRTYSDYKEVSENASEEDNEDNDEEEEAISDDDVKFISEDDSAGDDTTVAGRGDPCGRPLSDYYDENTSEDEEDDATLHRNDADEEDISAAIDDAYSHLKEAPINCDSFEVIVRDDDNNPLAVRAFIGRGELIIVSNPLMFTNYGILDRQNASYAFRLLNYLDDLPISRVEAYGYHTDAPLTPMRYILSVAPLRWAFYTTIALIIFFMIFTARRRQRIIPVVVTPPNRTLAFMQLISNLYCQKHDNAEILRMKYTYFCSTVKNQTSVDLQTLHYDLSAASNPQNHTGIDSYDIQRLAEKTGLPPSDLENLLLHIRVAIYSSTIDDRNLCRYLDEMKRIELSL